MSEYGNEPTREPDLQGDVLVPKVDEVGLPANTEADPMTAIALAVLRAPKVPGVARAWRVKAHAAEEHAGVGSDWLIHAPHGHPLWPWYALSVIHLRNLPTKGEAHVQYPGASHELLVLALNPEKPLPDVDRLGAPGTPLMAPLTPADQVVQFIVASDEQARELGDLVAKTIVGGVSPDQDLRVWWRSTIANTAEHLRLGGHPDG